MEELRSALQEVWPVVIETVEGSARQHWHGWTPCHPWTVADLVAHVGHAEGRLIHDFPQPEPPPGWSFEGALLHQMTNLGVASRAAWSQDEVVDEAVRAGRATLELLADPDVDWERPNLTPVGMGNLATALEFRLSDLYTHLCDLRVAFGEDLDPLREPIAAAGLVGRAVRLAGWAMVKQAGLAEGTRLRLDLTGPGAVRTDVVVVEGRGRLEEPSGTPNGTVAGSGVAYALTAGGRPDMAARLGLTITGHAAEIFLATYKLFG